MDSLLSKRIPETVREYVIQQSVEEPKCNQYISKALTLFICRRSLPS